MVQPFERLPADEFSSIHGRWKRSITFLLATASAVALFGCLAPDPAPRDWNVLLITIDTLRADHLSCYGYPRPTSPTIDKVAGDGVLFEQAIAQRSQTWPSVTSIMTSLYPHQHGVRRNGQLLESPVTTLAGVMQDHGYRTAANITNMRKARHPGFGELSRFGGDDRDSSATRAAIDWLEEIGDERFFLWIHYIAPHKPYRPPPPFDGLFEDTYTGTVDGEKKTLDQITLDKVDLSAEDLAHVIALYDGEIAYADEQVRQVLATLEDRDLAERTLVVITSDHGEELFQRNHYFYHSNSIYDSVLRVPWIVKPPDPELVESGNRVSRVVELIDMAPTILDLVGLPVPASFGGRSHASLVLGGNDSREDETAAFSELPWGVMSIRTARWRYIVNTRGEYCREQPYSLVEDARRDGYAIGREELYDRFKDSEELVDLMSGDSAELLPATLKARLEQWRGAWAPDTNPAPIDPEIEAELKALGYIE